jgi:hypothetical protein
VGTSKPYTYQRRRWCGLRKTRGVGDGKERQSDWEEEEGRKSEIE